MHSFIVSKLKDYYSPVWQDLEALNNKTAQSAASTTDAKEVLKTLMNDDDVDMLMDQLFQVSGATFTLSVSYLIASSLIRHPKQYAAIIDPKSKEGSLFKKTGTANDMKNYILSSFSKDDESNTAAVAQKPLQV